MRGAYLSEFTIRPATLNDAEQILSVYRPYIENTTDTLAIVVPSLETYKQQIANIIDQLAFVVVEIENKIIGYAFATRFQENRQAYKFTCITSIYVDPKYHGSGVSHDLYKVLEDKLKKLGIVQLYSNITATNIAGQKFHEKHQFTIVGQMPKFGYKFDEWHDILWMAKTLK